MQSQHSNAYRYSYYYGSLSAQEYDPTRFQPVLYCANSFDAMYQTLRDFLLAWE